MRTAAAKTDTVAERPLGLRRRPDLLIQPQRYGPEQYWPSRTPSRPATSISPPKSTPS